MLELMSHRQIHWSVLFISLTNNHHHHTSPHPFPHHTHYPSYPQSPPHDQHHYPTTARHHRQSSRPCRPARLSSSLHSRESSRRRRQHCRICSRRCRQSSRRCRLARLSSWRRFRGSSRSCCRIRRIRLLGVGVLVDGKWWVWYGYVLMSPASCIRIAPPTRPAAPPAAYFQALLPSFFWGCS